MIFIVLMLCFTYGLSSVLLLAAMNRWLKLERDDLTKVLLIGWGSGPLVIGWLLEYMFRLLPGHGDRAYIGGMLTIFAVLGVIGIKELPALGKAILTLGAKLFRWTLPKDFAALFLLGFVLWILYNAFGMALTQTVLGDDQLEYARLAQVFYESKSFEFYPNVTPNSPIGFALGSFHPVSFPMLITWSHIIGGSGKAYAFARLINPFFLTATAATFFAVFSGRSRIFATTAAFLYVCTPTIYSLTTSFHIDPFRIAAFQMCFAFLHFVKSRNSTSNWLLGGLGLGLSMNAHSTGLLTVPIAAVVLFLNSDVSVRRRIAMISVITTIGMLIGGHRYLLNFINLGSPVSDHPGVWKTFADNQETFVRVTRQIVTPTERVQFGLFRAFSEPQFYGWIYWAIPVSLVVLWKKWRVSPWAMCSMVVVMTYFLLATASVVLEGSTFIKNFRYFLTIQPMVASLAAFSLGTVHARFFRT